MSAAKTTRRRTPIVAMLVLVVALGASCAIDGGGERGALSEPAPAPSSSWFPAGEGRVTARWAGDRGSIDAGAESVPTFAVTVEGDDTGAVCVEKHSPLHEAEPLGARHPAEVGIVGAGQAAWLARHHHGIGTPLYGQAEHAALQLAVWRLTDGPGASRVTVPALAARVDELLVASEGQEAPNGPTAFVLDVTQVGDDGTVRVELTADGRPMAGEAVEVSDGATRLEVRTGVDGTATVRLGRAGTATARWKGQVPAGVVLEPAVEDGQALMTTEPALVVRSDRTDVTAPEPRRA